MGRRGGWLRAPARLRVATLVVGAVMALAPLGLWGATAPVAAKPEAAKPEAAKPEAAKPEVGKQKAKPSVVTVGPGARTDKTEKTEKTEKTDKIDKVVKTEKTEEKDGKAAGKPEAKQDGKPREKTAGTPEEKKDDKKDDKKDKAPAGAATAAKGARSGKSSASDEEPAPPTTPPIKMTALREEMSRPPHKEEQRTGSTRAERERLEQLASEINKAREGLRQDTARLEALLTARDLAAQASQASPAPAATGDGGDPPKKIPTTLDNLAKAIRGMKPEQAAPIISRVDRKLAADVLLRMPGGDAGKVLGVCKPEVAAEIAAEIASRTPRAELRR